MKLSAATTPSLSRQLSLVLPPAPRAAPPPLPTLALPNLPPLVRAKSLWQPWAGLVAAVPPAKRVGLKSLETRKQRIAPGLLVICAGLQGDAEWRERLLPRVPTWALPWLDITGKALALVMIGESRPLVPEDEPAAWFWAEGRKAMTIEACWPFKAPFKQRGQQGEFKVDREFVLEALGNG